MFCAGAVGFIVTGFATLEAKPVKESFAVGSRFDFWGRINAETKRPIGLQISLVAPDYAERLKDPKDSEGALSLIAEATRRALVVETFNISSTGWNIEVREYNTYGGTTVQ